MDDETMREIEKIPDPYRSVDDIKNWAMEQIKDKREFIEKIQMDIAEAGDDPQNLSVLRKMLEKERAKIQVLNDLLDYMGGA